MVDGLLLDEDGDVVVHRLLVLRDAPADVLDPQLQRLQRVDRAPRTRPPGIPRGDASTRAGSFFSTRFLTAFFVFFAFFRAAGRLTSTVGDSLSSGDDASAGSSAAPRAPPAPAAPA